MKKKRMLVKINLRLPAALKKQIEYEADRRNQTMADWIRVTLTEAVQKK